MTQNVFAAALAHMIECRQSDVDFHQKQAIFHLEQAQYWKRRDKKLAQEYWERHNVALTRIETSQARIAELTAKKKEVEARHASHVLP